MSTHFLVYYKYSQNSVAIDFLISRDYNHLYLLKKGFVQQNYYQELENGIRIYPKEYFSPYDYINCCYEITENSYCVHHFAVSWMPKSEQLKKIIKKRVVKVLGKNKMNMLRDKIKK